MGQLRSAGTLGPGCVRILRDRGVPPVRAQAQESGGFYTPAIRPRVTHAEGAVR
jgi:hypothetical protein